MMLGEQGPWTKCSDDHRSRSMLLIYDLPQCIVHGQLIAEYISDACSKCSSLGPTPDLLDSGKLSGVCKCNRLPSCFSCTLKFKLHRSRWSAHFTACAAKNKKQNETKKPTYTGDIYENGKMRRPFSLF